MVCGLVNKDIPLKAYRESSMVSGLALNRPFLSFPAGLINRM